MKSLKEKAKEEVDHWCKYYQGEVDRVKKTEDPMLELAELLDKFEVYQASFGSQSITITLDSVEASRKLLAKILEETKIEKFIKTSTQKSDGLLWGYHVDYVGVALTIYPAEPNKDCIVVKKTNIYTSWVCEGKE